MFKKISVWGTVSLVLFAMIAGCKSGTPTTPPTPKASPPVLMSVSPASGPINGGTPVTLTGTGFATGATVTFGGAAATGVSVVNATSITATTPAHAEGAVDIVVTNADGQSDRITNGFTYAAGGPFDVNGSWVGTTAVGGRFSFTVTNLKFVVWGISQLPNCPGLILSAGASEAITNNAFSYSTSGGATVQGTITGQFSSATSCSGNMNLTFSANSGCNAAGRNLITTWTATKQ